MLFKTIKNLEKKIIYTEISVMYKWLYLAFGTQILQYIIPVYFNTKSVPANTVKCIGGEFGVGLQRTIKSSTGKFVSHDKCYIVV